MSNVDPDYTDEDFREEKDDLMGSYWLHPDDDSEYADDEMPVAAIFVILSMVAIAIVILTLGIRYLANK